MEVKEAVNEIVDDVREGDRFYATDLYTAVLLLLKVNGYIARPFIGTVLREMRKRRVYGIREFRCVNNHTSLYEKRNKEGIAFQSIMEYEDKELRYGKELSRD